MYTIHNSRTTGKLLISSCPQYWDKRPLQGPLENPPATYGVPKKRIFEPFFVKNRLKYKVNEPTSAVLGLDSYLIEQIFTIASSRKIRIIIYRNFYMK